MDEIEKSGPEPSELSGKDRQIMDSNIESDGTEVELLPELIEQVMEKVKDINKYGTAIHVTRCWLDPSFDKTRIENELDTLRKVFSDGLLGWQGSFMGAGSYVFDKETWLKSVRSRKNVLCFNIVGRDIDRVSENPRLPQKVSKSKGYELKQKGINDVAVIFDISDFREGPIVTEQAFRRFKMERYAFYASGTDEFDISLRRFHPYIDSETGLAQPNPQYGFILSPRIRPSRFEGVVINMPTPEGKSAIVEALTKSYQKRPELLLPVYDQHGNLLWPKQMTYDEVKAFVEERDEKKEKKKE